MAKQPKAEEPIGGLQRLGRVKNHPVLGECVKVSLRHWQGPIDVGRTGRYAWTEPLLFPRDQGRFGSGKLLGGYDEAGNRRLTVASSVSYIDELRRYGNFRWARPGAPHDNGKELSGVEC